MEDEIKKNTDSSCGIISFKKLNNGLIELLFKSGRGKTKQTWTPSQENRDEFKEKLTELIHEIFDKSQLLEHKEDAKYCKYC